MDWTLSPFTFTVLVGAILALIVGITAIRHRPDPVALPLAVAMAGVVIWAVPHAISLESTSVDTITLLNQLQFPGVVIAVVGYLAIALTYAGYHRWTNLKTYLAISGFLVLSTLVVWTNDLHGWYWTDVDIDRAGNVTVFAPEFGPWYWMSLVYLYALAAVALIVFATVVARPESVYRKQAILMFTGGLVPLGTNVAFQLDIGPDMVVDLTTPALAVSGLMFALALYYFDLLEIRPVAYDRLLEELDDGVIVVGPEGKVRDFNRTVAELFDTVAIGEPINAVLSPTHRSDGGEIQIETETDTIRLRVHRTALTDDSGEQIGEVLYMNDITDLVEREQRISVLNRVLRHNVRNELNNVAGRLEILEDSIDSEVDEHLVAAKESTDNILEFAENARHIERTLHDGEHVPIDVQGRVERIVSEFSAIHPECHIEFETSDNSNGPTVSVVDEELFDSAINELLENAIVHNDRPEPTVCISVERGETDVSIQIADDGPGIPETERSVLENRIETHLHHGSGLGLWLVSWMVNISGGSLDFEENTPTGGIVTVTLPAEATSTSQ